MDGTSFAVKRLRDRVDKCIYSIYTSKVIKSFRHKGLQRLFEKADRSKVSAQHVAKLERILAALNVASKPDDLALPGFELHPLKGDRKGYWSVTVTANWRVIFGFVQGDVRDVDLVDYH